MLRASFRTSVAAVPAALLLALAVGCGDLPDPAIPGGPIGETPTGTPSGGNPSGPAGPTSPVGPSSPNNPGVPPSRPTVQGAPTRTGYDSVPLRGKTAPAVTVFVEGGQSPVATDADLAGNFCVDVPLKANQNNRLEVFAQDTYGLTSEAAVVTVQHDPSLEPQANTGGGGTTTTVELAEGTPAVADHDAKAGTLESLTDGDPTTAVTMPKSMIWIDLGEAVDISRVEIEFADEAGAGDDTFATEYDVLFSDINNPRMPPELGELGWQLLYTTSDGDGGLDSIDLSDEPVTIRYLAIYVIENNKTDWFDSENITLSELRVFGEEESEGPLPIAAPSCQNGGSSP